MKPHSFRHVVLLSLCLLAVMLPAAAQAQQSPPGVTVTCDNGASITNGVEIVVNQMRSGFDYTATAIGLNGFDPVLAVLDSSGNGLCNDDDATAAAYTFALPTTGNVANTVGSARVTFSQNSSSAFDDVSLVVGGFGDTTGEFVLILEGMAVTGNDGAGDPFSVRITPEMVASGVPLSVYMISLTNDLDPIMGRIDANGDIVNDSAGNPIVCDDGGDANRCWGQSASLANSGVITANGQVNGGQYDAMLSMDLTGLQLSADPDVNFYNFLMTSYNQSTTGQYLLAFHAATAPAGGTDTSGTFGDPNNQTVKGDDTNTSNNTQTNPNTGVPSGTSVTCDNGASFDNGVEVRVIQMRTGFDYTATAIGLNGFDPILAVLGSDGNGLCSDDDATAAQYALSLPTTGDVAASNRSARVTFANNSSNDFEDIRLVVGGFGNSTGEFVLVVEGMGVTSADGAGDPFEVYVTPGMTLASTDMAVYMISRTNDLDPLMYAADENLAAITDGNNDPVVCDDAGNANTCYPPNTSLTNSFIQTANGRVNGGQYDSMLVAPTSGMQLDSDPANNFFRFVFTSYQQQTTGQYLLAFHITTADAG
ncbi:MAG: hypothetical protein U0670_00190 [Anaerolineae bacterium]